MDDARIVEPVALGDDLGKAHLPGIEGDDDVVLVLVGKGHKGIAGGQILRFQQLLVGAVAAEDGGLRVLELESPTPVLPALHHLYLDARVLQQGHEIAGDLAAPHQEHPADLGGIAAQQAEELVQTVRLAHQIELVPHLGHKGAVGDEHPALPLYSAEQQGQPLDPAGQGVQGGAHQKVPLLKAKAHQLHPAPAEGLDIGGGGKAEQAGDLQGGGPLGVDHHVDLQVLAQLGQGAVILRVADAGDGIFCPQIFGYQGADHVHLVGIGGGHHQVGAVRPGLPQHIGGHAVALYRHNVQHVGGPAQGGLL